MCYIIHSSEALKEDFISLLFIFKFVFQTNCEKKGLYVKEKDTKISDTFNEYI